MSFSPLHRSKSVMVEDEMEDAPLLAEGCEGSQLADSGTVSGGTGDAAPGLEPCAGCGLLMNHDYYCVGCGKSIPWFCSEGDEYSHNSSLLTCNVVVPLVVFHNIIFLILKFIRVWIPVMFIR